MSNQMVGNSETRTVTVTNPQGLHARPAHALVSAASQYQSDVKITRGAETVDGKSILSVMTLAAEKGTQLTLTVIGDDAKEAVATLEALFLNGFGEESHLDENGEETTDVT